MHRDHKIFIQAIKNRKKILIKHRSENGCDANTKVCCPLFYVPASDKGGCDHYYFWEDEKGLKSNVVSVKTENIVHIGQTQEPFDPVGLTLVGDEDISLEH
ncbi:MAG: hypothetical protein ABSF37_09035 [Sedimentisphaerales bacterium]|jgi:hypothetical protein